MEIFETGDKIIIKKKDKVITNFLFVDTLRKPVLYPVYSPDGQVVTRSFPMSIKAGERIDHPHQVGHWFTFGDVNGIDFWNNSYAIPLQDLPKYGHIVVTGKPKTHQYPDSAVILAELEWLTHDNKKLLHETSRFTFQSSDSLTIIKRKISLVAMEDIVFTDNKEGMFAIRVAREFETPDTLPTLLTSNDGLINIIDSTGVNGRYLNSEGLEGTNAWGKRASWVILSAVKNKIPISIAMIDHPSNPAHPAHWHTRGYGLFSANNFGFQSFNPEKEKFSYSLEKGERIHFTYYLMIKSYSFLTAEEMNRLTMSLFK